MIRDAELLWLVDEMEPVLTSDVADALPIVQKQVYIRLRSLARRDFVTQRLAKERSRTALWELTAKGRSELTAADLPPARETDFRQHFAGRSRGFDPINVLVTIDDKAATADDWVPSTALYGDLPVAVNTVREKLKALHDRGLIACDERGRSKYWQITEQGRERLAAHEAANE